MSTFTKRAALPTRTDAILSEVGLQSRTYLIPRGVTLQVERTDDVPIHLVPASTFDRQVLPGIPHSAGILGGAMGAGYTTRVIRSTIRGW